MAFKIDTGVALGDFDPRSLMPDWFRDQHAEDAPFERLAFIYGQWIISEIDRPKKAETVRKHLVFSWRFLSQLEACHPEVFDEILVAYARRVEGIEDTAPGGSPGTTAQCAI